jgi:MFS transporter, ACS family, hexuronate transporter
MGAAENILRWRIAILVSTAIAISYLDRQTLPVAIKAISRDIPVTNEQFSTLQSAFLFAYALMYAGGGRLVDVLGTRLGLTAIMLFWSFACASHALATGFAMLAISRFLLGVGEGGGFPAATRVQLQRLRARRETMRTKWLGCMQRPQCDSLGLICFACARPGDL